MARRQYRHADQRVRFLTLEAAAEECNVPRPYIKKLVNEKKVRGGLFLPLKRWRIDMDSLKTYLRGKGYLMPDDNPTRVQCVIVVGTPLAWAAEFCDSLPAGLRSVYAGSCFEAGRVFERERPDLAVIDFRISRGDAIDLGARLTKAMVRCVSLANEDESDQRGLRELGFACVLKKPCKVIAVRDAIMAIMG
jgi:hypothetical protein